MKFVHLFEAFLATSLMLIPLICSHDVGVARNETEASTCNILSRHVLDGGIWFAHEFDFVT